MIKIADLSKTFNAGSASEVKALDQFGLEIEKEDFVTLIGSNGSGKSTLLNLIAGTYLPDNGSIQVDGTEISRWPEYKRSPLIARVFQDPLLGTASELSVLDNFRLAALRSKAKGLQFGTTDSFRKQVQDHIAMLGIGLENKLSQAMGALSGGQRQALTLSMAVMDKARVLLLDEPTAALDPKSSAIILQSAGKISSELKLCVLMVTHDMNEAASYGNRLIHMHQGKIVRDIRKTMERPLKAADLYEWMTEKIS